MDKKSKTIKNTLLEKRARLAKTLAKLRHRK